MITGQALLKKLQKSRNKSTNDKELKLFKESLSSSDNDLATSAQKILDSIDNAHKVVSIDTLSIKATPEELKDLVLTWVQRRSKEILNDKNIVSYSTTNRADSFDIAVVSSSNDKKIEKNIGKIKSEISNLNSNFIGMTINLSNFDIKSIDEIASGLEKHLKTKIRGEYKDYNNQPFFKIIKNNDKLDLYYAKDALSEVNIEIEDLSKDYLRVISRGSKGKSEISDKIYVNIDSLLQKGFKSLQINDTEKKDEIISSIKQELNSENLSNVAIERNKVNETNKLIKDKFISTLQDIREIPENGYKKPESIDQLRELIVKIGRAPKILRNNPTIFEHFKKIQLIPFKLHDYPNKTIADIKNEINLLINTIDKPESKTEEEKRQVILLSFVLYGFALESGSEHANKVKEYLDGKGINKYIEDQELLFDSSQSNIIQTSVETLNLALKNIVSRQISEENKKQLEALTIESYSKDTKKSHDAKISSESKRIDEIVTTQSNSKVFKVESKQENININLKNIQHAIKDIPYKGARSLDLLNTYTFVTDKKISKENFSNLIDFQKSIINKYNNLVDDANMLIPPNDILKNVELKNNFTDDDKIDALIKYIVENGENGENEQENKLKRNLLKLEISANVIFQQNLTARNVWHKTKITKVDDKNYQLSRTGSDGNDYPFAHIEYDSTQQILSVRPENQSDTLDPKDAMAMTSVMVNLVLKGNNNMRIVENKPELALRYYMVALITANTLRDDNVKLEFSLSDASRTEIYLNDKLRPKLLQFEELHSKLNESLTKIADISSLKDSLKKQNGLDIQYQEVREVEEEEEKSSKLGMS